MRRTQENSDEQRLITTTTNQSITLLGTRVERQQWQTTRPWREQWRILPRRVSLSSAASSSDTSSSSSARFRCFSSLSIRKYISFILHRRTRALLIVHLPRLRYGDAAAAAELLPAAARDGVGELIYTSPFCFFFLLTFGAGRNKNRWALGCWLEREQERRRRWSAAWAGHASRGDDAKRAAMQRMSGLNSREAVEGDELAGIYLCCPVMAGSGGG